MWYSPDEVEFYLVDFKKGVEFKTYATSQLPHARAIAVESDREFGLSVLQRVDGELTRRGDLFRNAGVQEISRVSATATGQKLPRTLLLIDEFQEFFSEDDKLGAGRPRGCWTAWCGRAAPSASTWCSARRPSAAPPAWRAARSARSPSASRCNAPKPTRR